MVNQLDPQKNGLLFLHIPKTGGVSLKAALENSFHAKDSCVGIRDEDDRYVDPHESYHRLITGHVGPNLVRSVAATHNRFTVLRHPLERCLSHALHDFRHRQTGYDPEAYANADSVVTAIEEGESKFFQNAFLCEALEIPPVANRWQIDEKVLDGFALVGVSSEQRKLLQMLSHGYRTLPTIGNWKLNEATNRNELFKLAPLIRPLIKYFRDDMETYRLGTQRFYEDYRSFAEQRLVDVCDVDLATDEMIENVLLDDYLARLAANGEVDEFVLDMSGPQPGSGWSFREHNHILSYRWLGPELESVAYLPPLRRADYEITIEMVAIASQRIIAETAIWVGDHRIDRRFETLATEPHEVRFEYHGIIREECLPKDGGPVPLRIVCPETLPVLATNRIAHTGSTVWNDTRLVSLAIARISVRRRTPVSNSNLQSTEFVSSIAAGFGVADSVANACL